MTISLFAPKPVNNHSAASVIKFKAPFMSWKTTVQGIKDAVHRRTCVLPRVFSRVPRPLREPRKTNLQGLKNPFRVDVQGLKGAISYAFSRAWGALKTPQGAIFKAQRCLENFLEDSSSRAWARLSRAELSQAELPPTKNHPTTDENSREPNGVLSCAELTQRRNSSSLEHAVREP